MITVKICLDEIDSEPTNEKEYTIPESITYHYKGEETVAMFNLDEQAYMDREFYWSAKDYIKSKLVNLAKNTEKDDGFNK